MKLPSLYVACVAISLAISAAVSGALSSAPATAAPFVPDDDAQVLETGLPNADPRMRQMRRLGAEVAAHPDELGPALDLASRQLAMGVAEADPRFVGYARGTLARWWRSEPATPALRIMRARILQAQHDFAGAANDLDAVLRDAPETPPALLLLASIDEAVGDFAAAKEACGRFQHLRPGLVATACAASVASQSGELDASYGTLSAAVAQSDTTDPGQLAWALTILGEIAIRKDDPAAADYLQQTLSLDQRNVYALTVLADYLLDHDQAAEASRMLRGFERIDALYLRLTLAAQKLGDPNFPKYRDDLAARFAAARRQGDTVHLRDAARFALEIEHDGARALALAEQNWTTHKTAYDARPMLAAAITCKSGPAAATIAAWARANHVEDRTIAKLLAEASSILPVTN